MWPISNFLMTVWIFFQIRLRPLSYVVLNQIHIRCFAVRRQSERPFHEIFTSLKCDWRHNSALEEAGRLKSQYIDYNITSLFRLRLHINFKIAKHTLTRAASIFISANVWRHVFFCACESLQGRVRFTHDGWQSHLMTMWTTAQNPIWALRPAVWTESDVLEWCGYLVDYCDVFISCLDSHSDGTHSLQRIYWWVRDAMLHFSKSVLMKKQTHPHLEWPVSE